MSVMPIVNFTDNEFSVVDANRYMQHEDAFEAMIHWCEHHGIDPMQLPMEGVIRRDTTAKTITHGRYNFNGLGFDEVVKQLDTEPLPWPDEILSLARVFGGLTPVGTAYVIADGPKMLRETLCVAQSGIAELVRKGQKSAGGTMQSHMDRLGRLIEECDRHRPLGRGGKHGELHTPTCGCDR